MTDKTYSINEVFYSIQGEGIRAGTPNVFVRFSGCNLECSMEEGPKSPGGFDCDTEFVSGRRLTKEAIFAAIEEAAEPWHRFDDDEIIPVILTGGEPALQVDSDLCRFLKEKHCYLAIETNGSIQLDLSLDWITVSPKVAEHALKQRFASEVKYVRRLGQALPKTQVRAGYYLISPAFDGNELDRRNLEWCLNLIKENPEWRLSPQMHKVWGVA